MNARPIFAQLCAFALLILIGACAGAPELAPASTAAREPSELYRIGPGDTIKVFV